MTGAQQDTLDSMADGSVLHLRWTGERGLLVKPNGMTCKVQRRVAIALVKSGLLTKIKYDGRLRDSYVSQPNESSSATGAGKET